MSHELQKPPTVPGNPGSKCVALPCAVSLHQGAARILEFFASQNGPALETLSAAEARAEFDRLVPLIRGDLEDVGSVSELEIPGPGGRLRLRVYRGKGAAAEQAAGIVYFHGGGWVLGGLESHDDVCRTLANAALAVVICVDYRLAPEFPFPAGFDDCHRALCYAAENSRDFGIDPGALAVAGDSAGGCLAAATAIRCQRESGPDLAAQLLFYPNTDARLNTPSVDLFSEGFGLTEKTMRWFRDSTAPDPAAFTDWRLSPLLCDDLSGLPPCFAVLAEADILRDEAIAYCGRLKAAGVDVEYDVWPGQIHGFVVMGRFIDQAAPAIRSVASAFSRLAGKTPAADISGGFDR